MKSISKDEAPLSFIKLLSCILITASVILLVVILGGELMVRWLNPQVIIYPKWTFSYEYGHVLPKDCRMDHYFSDKWHYVYTINGYGYRGPQISVSNHYPTKNIIILGDSYAFGTGVQDGEEFAEVMQRNLNGGFAVINLAVAGYGLTQQIRRYYEFGQIYKPSYVILQFCQSDPIDNFRNKVTEISEGRFVFTNTQARFNWVSSVRSSAIFQKSQLYNFILNFIQIRFKSVSRHDEKDNENQRQINRYSNIVQTKELDETQDKFYIELLAGFARDLSENGIKLVIISVNEELDSFKMIRQAVNGLQQAGVLTYLEVEPWFKGQRDFGSPEGHRWGVKAHTIIGQHLAAFIKEKEALETSGGASSQK